METTTAILLKERDVYHVRYTEEYKANQKGDLNHCFEGLAIVKVSGDNLYLQDTYWGLSGSSGRTFTISQIGKDINIEFYCNLNEITQIKSYEREYYMEQDVFILHEQHACSEGCKHYFIRKGAERSREEMMGVVRAKIDKARKEIEYKTNDLVFLGRKLYEVENSADLTKIYI